MRLIKWSKLPILGSVIAAFALGRATASVGTKETPLMLKTRSFLKNLKLQRTLSSKIKSARKLGAGALRLTSDLLSVSADLLNPKAKKWSKYGF